MGRHFIDVEDTGRFDSYSVYMTIYYRQPDGRTSIVCSCGFCDWVNNYCVCPDCGEAGSLINVSCADPSHNENDGCGNSKCFKHKTGD